MTAEGKLGETPLSNHPLHRIAARLRFVVNQKGLGWGGKR